MNSLSRLAWHTAKEINFRIALIAGVQPVWITAGHKERFALDLLSDAEDWHYILELAAKIVVGDISVFASYPDDAYTWVNDCFRGLKEGDFAKIIDDF